VDVAHAALRQTLIAMDALDGNAIAGWLFEHFGSEMTTVVGRCRHCGTRSLIAELAVYTRALVPSRAAGRAATWCLCS
jgi:hypothetical protein